MNNFLLCLFCVVFCLWFLLWQFWENLYIAVVWFPHVCFSILMEVKFFFEVSGNSMAPSFRRTCRKYLPRWWSCFLVSWLDALSRALPAFCNTFLAFMVLLRCANLCEVRMILLSLHRSRAVSWPSSFCFLTRSFSNVLVKMAISSS